MNPCNLSEAKLNIAEQAETIRMLSSQLARSESELLKAKIKVRNWKHEVRAKDHYIDDLEKVNEHLMQNVTPRRMKRAIILEKLLDRLCGSRAGAYIVHG